MRYYVIADPHGFCKETRAALDEAGFFSDERECRLVVLGDLLDRGDEPEEIVDLMLDIKKAGKLIYVLGNHEELMVDALQSIAKGEIFAVASPETHHYRNGTWHSLLGLSGMGEAEAIENPIELCRRVLDHRFYRELLPEAIDYFETENYVFVHGYIPCKCQGYRVVAEAEYDPDWRDAPPERWRRARWHNGMELCHKFHVREEGKTVLCGHWHTSYGHSVIEGRGAEYGADADYSPFFGDGVIGLDGCVRRSGKVNCIVIED